MAFCSGSRGPVDFTYGPLGFLIVPDAVLPEHGGLQPGFLVGVAAAFALLLHATRPKLPGLWSVLVTYIVGASAILLVDPADLLMGCV